MRPEGVSPSGAPPDALQPTLAEGLRRLGLSLDERCQSRLLTYLRLIAKWTAVYNLTAVRDPAEMLTHHLLDSLAVVAPLAHQLHQRPLSPAPVQVLDVGAGAGLPGVALALSLPASIPLQVTCVDAVAKKVGFIRQVAAELGLAELKAVHGRIENLELRAADVITCRAFASLADIVRLTDRHLAPQGVWMAMKGQVPELEIQALPQEIEVFHVEPLQVPFLEAQRCLVWMRRR